MIGELDPRLPRGRDRRNERGSSSFVVPARSGSGRSKMLSMRAP